ncbi:MAG: hypothetical protein R2706_13955 [Acidimicrobiales bacterium]
MIAPVLILDEVMGALSRDRFTDYVELWQADHLGPGEMTKLVAGAWISIGFTLPTRSTSPPQMDLWRSGDQKMTRRRSSGI